jgi:hypothetical protein
MTVTAPTCLLVIPRHFYSFERHIREGLEAKGYQVTVINDEFPEGMLGKILGKLQIPYIFTATWNTFSRQVLDGRRFDLVLIFKGRGMSVRLIEALRAVSGRVVAYNWDSFQLNRSPLRWFKSASRYLTFDYRDAERWQLPVVELFSAAKTVLDNKQVQYEVSSIVRNHSGRLRYIDQVLRVLRPATQYIAIFELNVFTFLFNFIRSPLLYIKYWKHITFKPVPYAEYSRVMAASAFTIDYAHDTQTGITMRCFEAVNSRTKIITNNPYMTRSPHFAPGDYLVIEDGADGERLRKAFEAARSTAFASRPRTIGDFISELIAH